MALIQLSKDILSDIELFDIVADSFDSIEQVEQRAYSVLFRVQNEEITKEDKVICPEMYRFEGIRPFVISWDID